MRDQIYAFTWAIFEKGMTGNLEHVNLLQYVIRLLLLMAIIFYLQLLWLFYFGSEYGF